ncbi:MAG: GTP pyrophosphokinase [Lachnospiraceae bacterium]|nr:GTP pyrophosphokinase [Lachnospiraceae bacterium]
MQPLEKINSKKNKARYEIVLHTLLNKFEIINTELSMEENRIFIHNTSGRIKNMDSIQTKLVKKGCEPGYEMAMERINDIVGVRAVCYYMDDLYRVADTLSRHTDMEILRIKNYMEHPKKSGYRSLHMIVKVMITFSGKQEWVKAEIQLRTFAMDYWAVLDHQLRYKKGSLDINAKDGMEIEKELLDYAGALETIDKKMMKIRDKIEKI